MTLNVDVGCSVGRGVASNSILEDVELVGLRSLTSFNTETSIWLYYSRVVRDLSYVLSVGCHRYCDARLALGRIVRVPMVFACH